MDEFKQKLNALLESDFPAALHANIMRRVFILRYRNALLAFWAAVTVNFLVSGWNLWSNVVESDIVAIMKIAMGDLEMDYAMVKASLDTFMQFAPLPAIVFFLMSSGFLAFGIYLFFKFRSTVFPSHNSRQLTA